MKNYQKVGKIYSILFLLLIIILFFLVFNKSNLLFLKKETINYLQSQNLGFSNRIGLVDDGTVCIGCKEEDYEYYKMMFKQNFITNITKIIKYKIRNPFSQNFEKINIDIKFKETEKLLNNKKYILKNSDYSNKKKVDGIIRYKKKLYDAIISLKGQSIGHYNKDTRYSLKIELKNNETILGFNKFSIQEPIERYYPYNDYFGNIYSKNKNLILKNEYLNVYFNGKKWGIMNLQENISEHYSELNRRKESVLVEFGLDLNHPSQIHESYKFGDDKIYVNSFNNSLIKENLNLRKKLSFIIDNYTNRNTELFNLKNLSEALLLSTIWGNYHDISHYNAKFYFNPYTLKLEFISNDQGRFNKLNNYENIENFDLLPWYYLRLFNKKILRDSYEQYSKIIKKSFDESLNDLENIREIFPVDQKKELRIIDENIKFIDNNYRKVIIKLIKSNEKNIKEIEFISNTKLKEFKDFIHFYHFDNGKFVVFNLLPYDIKLKNITNGDYEKKININLPSYTKNKKPLIFLDNEFTGILDKDLSITASYNDINKRSKNNISLFHSNLFNPLVDNKYNLNIVSKIDKNNYKFKKGNLKIIEPIKIKGNLYIENNTNLYFSNDTYLIVEGCIIFNNNKTIKLTSENEFWNGIYVYNCNGQSIVKNAEFSNIKNLKSGSLDLTGSLNFYKTKVKFNNVKITNIYSEDALNIIKSDYDINKIFIENTLSDAIDIDFSNGSIDSSKFINIGGDALDFSGSKSNLINIKINKVKDKGISIGEKSNINMKEIYIDNAMIGVAIKDGSISIIDNILTKNIEKFDIATYQKKKYYKGSTANVTNYESDDKKLLNEINNLLKVNNKKIAEKKYNIKKLYN